MLVYPPTVCPFCGGASSLFWSAFDRPSRSWVDCWGCRACDRERWLDYPRSAPPPAKRDEDTRQGRLF